MGLHGRSSEREAVDAALDGARNGVSRIVVIEGEPGIGKTALCGYAVAAAAGFVVLAAQGVQAETALPFAALTDLLRPLVDLIPTLPEPQLSAVSGALALAPVTTVPALAVGLGTLNLLAAAAERSPVLAVVDDAHRLDAASAQALTFAARRLNHDGIALVIAQRPADGSPIDVRGGESLLLSGLDPSAGAALLAERSGHAVDADVARQLIDATGGNPLALVELAAALHPSSLIGDAPLPSPLPIGAEARSWFGPRIAAFPPETRRALLVVATDDTGALELITPALRALDLDLPDLEVAETLGVVTVTAQYVSFSHPLLRSAVSDQATPPDRRAAHKALADAAAGRSDHAREAWHLSAATVGSDTAVAAALERLGNEASMVGGAAAAADALERAARLSPAGEDRARRHVAAAHALLVTGRLTNVDAYAEEALRMSCDPILRARAGHLRALSAIWSGRRDVAFKLSMDAAQDIERDAPEEAAQIMTEAVLPMLMNAELDAALPLAQSAYELVADRPGPVRLLAMSMLADVLQYRGDADASRALFQQCRADWNVSARASSLSPTIANALSADERYDDALQLINLAIDTARADYTLASLPVDLASRADIEFYLGRWANAFASASEAVRLAEETGQVVMLVLALSHLARMEAVRGDAAAARSHATKAIAMSHDFGASVVDVYGGYAMGLLALGQADNEEAVVWLRPLRALWTEQGVHEPGTVRFAPDLVEALIRSEQTAEARDTLEWFEHDVELTNRTWGRAAALRCRALLAAGDDADDLFAEACRYHERTSVPFEQARTELYWGEWLRRRHRSKDARHRLRSALSTFERLGAAPWAERARRELRAGGDTVALAGAPSIGRLSPQELQVALTVARGATNREAAQQMFLSPKTVEFHLSNVYRKLGITARSQLRQLLDEHS